MITDQCAQVIMELGFTELEAEIFVHLVQHSPATGYGIAKAIGRSNANTYKAIATLESKGAVLVDHGTNRLCRAVPVDELLNHIERRFHERKDRAVTLLSQLKKAPQDERIYQLNTPDQVYERARRMLEECEETALLELFPEPLAILHDDVEKVADRGVRVSVRIYEPADLDNVKVILSPTGADTLQRVPVQLMTLFTDANQCLIAMIVPGGKAVHQAVWSSNPFLAWSYYTFVFSDFLLSSLLSSLETAGTIEELRAEYEKLRNYYHYPEGDIKGIHEFLDGLQRKYGTVAGIQN